MSGKLTNIPCLLIYKSTYYLLLHLYLGPKGVINDWRRFKLESMDQEALPPNKRELLRQMSSPQKPKDATAGGYNRKVAYCLVVTSSSLTVLAI